MRRPRQRRTATRTPRGLREHSIWVQTSTVGVSRCERLATLAGELGVPFVDAPVLGARQPATRDAGLDPALMATSHGRLRRAAAAGHDAPDMSATYLEHRPSDSTGHRHGSAALSCRVADHGARREPSLLRVPGDRTRRRRGLQHPHDFRGTVDRPQ